MASKKSVRKTSTKKPLKSKTTAKKNPSQKKVKPNRPLTHYDQKEKQDRQIFQKEKNFF